MSYSMIGAIGAASFKLVNGIAKPIDKEALENFKAFQQELSRFGALRVDGDIGPATVKLYNKIANAVQTAAQIATGIPLLTGALKLKASNEGKPAAKPLPPSRPVQKSDGTWTEANPPGYTPETFVDTAMGFVTSPWGIGAAAGVVGLLIFLKRRKSGGASAPLSLPKVP